MIKELVIINVNSTNIEKILDKLTENPRIKWTCGGQKPNTWNPYIKTSMVKKHHTIELNYNTQGELSWNDKDAHLLKKVLAVTTASEFLQSE